MKYFLSLGFMLLLLGCSAPTITPDTHNAVIPLGNEDVGIFIPESWEKIPAPSENQNIILLARNGDENIAVSFEENEKLVTGRSLCNGAQNSFSPFEQSFADEDHCFFSGHPAPNTPLRNFWQKVIHVPNETYFLLASCSAEQISASTSECPTILDSFHILDTTK